ncbi:unnamed protein product [Parnassius apollo]|uniref:(apollo) hypothetical protein n=1 Tax=Parnassius apollo TaxID=110799 RepID=A0A8S3WI10_PARAO|nr:unnamed protein product [Parnassius apollo]
MSSQSSLSDSEEEELLLLVSVLKRKRRIWVHEINQKRRKLGENKLCLELQSHEDRFCTYFRMKPIKKKNTNYREAIPTKERLALCLSDNDQFAVLTDTTTLPLSKIIKDRGGHVLLELRRLLMLLEPEFVEILLGSKKCYREKWRFPL